MQKIITKLTTVLIIVGVLVGGAFAKELADTEQIPLSNILRELVQSNPEIRESIEVYEGVKEEIEFAKSGYRPSIGVELSGGQQVTDGVASDEERRDLTASTAGIYARQNLFRGKGTEHHLGETKARKLAAAYEVLNVANRVFTDTVEAYVGVLQERELLALAEENVYTQAQILDQIKVKTENGFGRKSDLFNAQSRLALARANVISQQQNLKQAAVRFHRQFGRYVDPKAMVRPKAEYKIPDIMEEFIELALKNYPAIDVAKYNIVTRKYTMKRTESQFYPTLDAELRADYRNNTGGDEGDTKSYSAMLYLNYEFYDGGKRSAEKKKNYRQILKENERLYIERRNLIEAVKLAWNIKLSEDSKNEFVSEHVNLSLKTLEAFKEEYQLGRRTLLELLDMENEHQESKKALVQSDYASLTAYYRLLGTSSILISEYETELYDRVDLQKRDLGLDTLDNYVNIETDRDLDKWEDTLDQCDNSMVNTETNSYGCGGADRIDVGYQRPKALTPYIKPKEEDSLGDDEELALGGDELEEAESLGEAETVAEVKDAETTPMGGPEEGLAVTEVLDFDKGADEHSFNFEDIKFSLNSSRLTGNSKRLVKKIGEDLLKLDSFKLDIIGHTDTSGRADFNLKLSRQRAEAVYAYLAKMGVEPGFMTAYGKGEGEPLYSNSTRAGRKKNRRIEFKIQQVNQKE